MKIKIFDNGDTNCRELWINGRIIHAVNLEGSTPSTKAPANLLEATINFGEWAPNTVHMETKG